MAKHPYTNVIARSPRFSLWSDLIHQRFDRLPLEQIFKSLTDIVPEILLPWQGDEFSLTGVDGFALAVTNPQKRALIKAAVELHAYKGTPWSIREIISRLGYGEVVIETGFNNLYYDGEAIFDGKYYYGDKGKWALYSVKFSFPITNFEAQVLRNVLRYFAPAHCSLRSLDFTEAPLVYDGTADFDGKYNFGAA